MTLKFWRWPLSHRILLGLAAGAAAGILAKTFLTTPEEAAALRRAVEEVLLPLGRVFIRLITMVVLPLLFSAIVLGVLEIGDPRKLGRMGARCLGFTVLLAAIGVGLGLGLVNLVRPGDRVSAEQKEQLRAQYAGEAAAVQKAAATAAQPIVKALVNLIPANPLAEAAGAFGAASRGTELIAFMLFALLFGLGLAAAPLEKTAALREVFSGLFEVCMRLIGFALLLAPVCVALLGFSLTATLGGEVVTALALYVAVVIGGLALHLFGTYSFFLATYGRKSPRAFFRQTREALVTAFSTSSSNATLPVSLRVAEEELGLPRRVSRFVLTLGASANQNGTALYEGVTVLFLAQVMGVDLSLGQQLTVAALCILAGIGTAGIPGGSLPLVVGAMTSVGVPGESIALILGIDRLLDMARTALNVGGDLVLAQLVARGEPPAAEG